MPYKNHEIAQRLKALRQANGWMTQKEFAERIGVGRRTITWIEQGSEERGLPVHIASQICQSFGVTLDWLYHGDDRLLPTYLARVLAGKGRTVFSDEEAERKFGGIQR